MNSKTVGMQVDTNLVRELAEMLNDTGLSEITVEDGERKIKVSRTMTAAPAAPAAPPPATAVSAPICWMEVACCSVRTDKSWLPAAISWLALETPSAAIRTLETTSVNERPIAYFIPHVVLAITRWRVPSFRPL